MKTNKYFKALSENLQTQADERRVIPRIVTKVTLKKTASAFL